MRGYDPDDAVVEVPPRPGEYTLRTEDIFKVTEAELLKSVENLNANISLKFAFVHLEGTWRMCNLLSRSPR